MPTLLNRDRVRKHLEDFDLYPLFIDELGWDNGGEDIEAKVSGSVFLLEAVAHKRGMVIYRCVAESGDDFPDRATRQKIEKIVNRAVREHIIVYVARNKRTQCWQWVKREPGQSARYRDYSYRLGQTFEPLIQMLEKISFSRDEEPNVTLLKVLAKSDKACDPEKVTKKFYERFKKEHHALLGFITGIEDFAEQEWYASLMMNRMMFIYFIQKRGFLDEDTDYLRNRLRHVQETYGKGEFHTFYRLFLLRLFHEGLGQPEADRSDELHKFLGQIPYLNGGLFDVHDLERNHLEIHIPDEAFEKIFAFFASYQWLLDDQSPCKDNEINPDVLGHIFEKYINQKQMGAYYTKEDITGYIGLNVIIPFLFDQAKKDCPSAFKPGSAMWRLLSDDPDRYFYEAVRHGITYDMPEKWNRTEKLELPHEIAAGIDDASKRGEWNKPTPPEYALPTETWREHIARRQRYEEIRAKLDSGEVASINDLITYNLDIEKFCQDVIAGSEHPDLVRAFWNALSMVSVLDPTCGSGAFLFAALNILEPIYTACLDAMHGFVNDPKNSERKYCPVEMRDCRQTLDKVNEHANERYFVLKSIIVNNLYGVDIMKEAVEICKLRLFLKLVSQLESYDQIEPLPDIDFNVRSGNALVGFTTLEEIRVACATAADGQGKLPYDEFTNRPKRIEKDAKIANQVFKRFRKTQTQNHIDADALATAKRDLQKRLDGLRTELDQYLASEYGIKADDMKAYEQWAHGHRPFHWFVEFHGIMDNGGFDVIIGNPPYVKAKEARQSYSVRGLACGECPDIYAWVLDRSQALLRPDGRAGMIVPLSLGFSNKFEACRRLLFSRYSNNWFSSFGRIPSNLFGSDVRVRNTIHLALKQGEVPDAKTSAHTTRLHRWNVAARPTLFQTLQYAPFQPELWKQRVPKLNTAALANTFERLLDRQESTFERTILPRQQKTRHVLHFRQTVYNWLTFCRKMPPCYDHEDKVIPHTKFRELYFENAESCELAMLLSNGKLMLIFWLVVGDDFVVNHWNFNGFPADFRNLLGEQIAELLKIVPRLETAMTKAIQYKLNANKKVGNYNLRKCREITDLSDRIFCEAFGLSDVWDDIELYYAQTIRTDPP